MQRDRFDGIRFDFIRVNKQLSTQPKWLPLQDPVDEFHGLTSLLFAVAVRDLVGIKLKVEAVNSDGFHVTVYRHSPMDKPVAYLLCLEMRRVFHEAGRAKSSKRDSRP
jgi:hypothetical protein